MDPPAVGVAPADPRWAQVGGRTDLPPGRACDEVARRLHAPCDPRPDPPIPHGRQRLDRGDDTGSRHRSVERGLARGLRAVEPPRHPETRMFPWWMLRISQEMQRFPGIGWPLVRIALEGPLVIERRFGLRGLSWFLEDGWGGRLTSWSSANRLAASRLPDGRVGLARAASLGTP
jgi:hypothetical protein